MVAYFITRLWCLPHWVGFSFEEPDTLIGFGGVDVVLGYIRLNLGFVFPLLPRSESLAGLFTAG